MKYDLEKLIQENMSIQESPSEELKERILHYDKEERMMNQKRKYMRHVPKIAAAALTVVILSGGVAYASPRLWNHFVAKNFGVEKDPEMMQNMNDQGFAQQPHMTGEEGSQLSVTDKDITVTVKQTLADEHSAYVCYEVKYGDQYQPVRKAKSEESDSEIATPERVDYQLNSVKKVSACSSMNKVVDDHTVLYDCFLSTMDEENTFKDSVLTMSMSSFVIYGEDDETTVLAKDGKWELSWNLSVGTEKQVYHLDRTLTLGKDHVIVKDLEISPLSCYLTMENPDGVTLDDLAAVVEDDVEELAESSFDENGDLKVIRYLRTGSSEKKVYEMMQKLPKGQTLLPLDSMAIRLDGKDFDGMSGMAFTTGDEIYQQFTKVLNPEEVRGVRIAGKYIDLTGISPETVR